MLFPVLIGGHFLVAGLCVSIPERCEADRARIVKLAAEDQSAEKVGAVNQYLSVGFIEHSKAILIDHTLSSRYVLDSGSLLTNHI